MDADMFPNEILHEAYLQKMAQNIHRTWKYKHYK